MDLGNGTLVDLRDFDLGHDNEEADSEDEEVYGFYDGMPDDELDNILPAVSNFRPVADNIEEEASDDEIIEVRSPSVELCRSPTEGESSSSGASHHGIIRGTASSTAALSEIDDLSVDLQLSNSSPRPPSIPQVERPLEPSLLENASLPTKKRAKRLRGVERELPADTLTAIEYHKYRDKQYNTLNHLLEENLDEIKRLGNLPAFNRTSSTSETFNNLCHECQIIRKVIIEKYRILLDPPKKKRKRNDHHHPATSNEMNKRLGGISGDEETIHPWSTSSARESRLPLDGMLFRVIDEKSQAKLYPDIGFLSASGEAMLDTVLKRHLAIKQHINWGNKKPTCFVSTTDCPYDFEHTWLRTLRDRDLEKPSVCTVLIACINVNARLAKGWPVVSVVEETKHYKVEADASYLAHEFLLPFRCSPEEIVGIWCWTVVEDWMNKNCRAYIDWHKAVVVPAFKAHETARLEGRTTQGNTTCTCGCH